MAEIIMPKVGDAMTEGKVVRWYKKAGDAVKLGEPVAEIETDKVNMDLEADEEGVVDQILVEEGASAEVGKPLALLRGEGEAAAPRKSSGEEPRGEDTEPPEVSEKEAAPKKKAGSKEETPPKKEAAPEEAPPEEAAPKKESASEPEAKKHDEPEPKREESDAGRATTGPVPREEGRARSSPLARKMAADMGVDLAAVSGSGPRGRIVAADIEQAAKGGGPKPAAKAAGAERPSPAIEAREVPLTSMRKTIARRLSESLGPIPHFFLTIEADVTSLLATRQQLNEIHDSKVSINDFVIRACALVILEHPYVNSSFGAEAIRQHGEVHIGIAVATAEGLITPVIRNADRKSVLEIATEVRTLAEKARNRKLMPDEYQGSTFTISNLGMYGIEEFTAIINPPNAAIVAVGAAVAKPVVVDGQVVVRDRMRLTMSCDHRVIDGAAGAEYMQTLQRYLEQPLRLVIAG
jgi:pyruvate dehydrogenase E2 component (dihydrolipoamide acetyltransferase)